MELSYNANNFEDLTSDEMLLVNGGLTKAQWNALSIACSIVGIGLTPAAVVAAAGPMAVVAAAAGGVSALIGLISSLK